MMRTIARLLLLACLFGGTAMAQTGNNAHDRLAAMSIAEQRETLTTLMNAPPRGCQVVSGAYFAGLDLSRIAYWDVRCRGGATWRIALPPEDPAPRISRCPRDIGACFVPVARSNQNLPSMAHGRCETACDIHGDALRQACVATCLEGSETIAPSGAAAAKRHIVIFAGDLSILTEGFLAGAEAEQAAADTARRSCEATTGMSGCRLVVTTVDRCVAAAQAPGGDLFSGLGSTLGEAEDAALRACGRANPCQMLVSGC